ncbi:response regulator [Phaeospirillum tilakii]|uniref:histidine kinase n=1 Tax=Phaeospirillum tilakii TaxID=741673 RepID=A0ABW5CE71_9PROT
MSVRESSIASRLTIGFALVLALAVAVSILAVVRAQQLSEVTSRLYDHPFVVNREVLLMRVAFTTMTRELTDLAEGRALEHQQAQMLRIAQGDGELITRLARIRERYLGPREDVDRIEQSLTQWRALRDDVVELARDRRFDQARPRNETVGRELAERVDASLESVTGFSLRRAAAFLTEARQRQNQLENELSLATLALLGIGALAAALIVRGIVRPLRALRGAMLHLAGGQLDTPLPAGQVAREIAAMTEGLAVFKATARRLADQGWIRNEIGRLTMALQRAETPQAFAAALIGGLAPLVGAAVGMVHLRDGEQGRFRPFAGYGCGDDPAVLAAQAVAGHGLVAQCAAQQGPLLLTDLPEDYVAVGSGVGAAVPRLLLLVPVVNQGETRAVIELAAFTPFSELHRALIEAALPVVALTLEVLERGLLGQRLLEESRQQAEELRLSQEELQSQSEELRAANRQLSEQRRELEQARRRADQRADDFAAASRFKSEFLANMSHELRTPLNSLLILSHGLCENADGTLTPDQIESARVIHDSGTHLLRMINDILDLSKVEAGKLELVETSVRPAEIAAAIRRTFAPIAGQKRLYFTITCAPEVPAAFGGDPGRIEQIITNLVANACKFTAQGGVTVRLTALPPCGEAGEGPLGRLRVEVADTGIGIAPDKRDRIFEAFEQADGSIGRQFGGTGLGLSIARHLTDLMGGTLTADSEEGRGSTFTLALPLRPPPAADAMVASPTVAATPPVPLPPAAGAGATVLIVEDDDDFAAVLCDLAQRRGLNPVRAGDGVEGLGLARHLRPAGILLDVGLPGLDGWAVMEALRHDPQTRAIPVHFLSGSPEVQRGLAAGAVGFLTKPVERAQLDRVFSRLGLDGAGEGRRVLVVDDDDAFRVAVRPLVESDRVEVREAATAGEALDLLGRERFDCLILDLILPDFSGFDLLDRARDAGVALPPVVVHSGMELTFDQTLRLRAYTDSIVVKGSRSPERLVDEVALFLHSVQAEPPAEPAPVREALFVDRSVLVVDDDMRNAFALSKLLRGRGFTVEIAEDGARALARLEQGAGFDLVLMDIMMPGMDGFAAIAEIRRRPGLAELPILALTAKAMAGDREQCLAAGANDHLAKPIDIERLFALIRRWLPPRGEAPAP